MKGRRGFLSGMGKAASLGGAALLLPRDALAEVSRSSELLKATEEVYIEESYELGPEQVKQLMLRIKELEGAIANPPWFQGKQGVPGEQGYCGPPGAVGATGRDGAGSFEGVSVVQDYYGNTSIVDQNGNAITIPQPELPLRVEFIDAKSRYDGQVDKHMLLVDGAINDLPTCKQVDQLQDCVNYLMKRVTYDIT